MENIKILQWNIHNRKTHFSLLKDVLYRDAIDVAIQRENTFKDTYNLIIPGYQQYNQFHSPATTRGLLTSIRISIPSNLTLNPASCGSNIESLAVTVRLDDDPLDICNIYRPP